MEKRETEGYEYKDWYLCFKKFNTLSRTFGLLCLRRYEQGETC